MKITRLALQHALGETRAAAFAGTQPVALFTDPLALRGRARVGDIVPARLGPPAPDGGGFFVTLEGKGDAYLSGKPPAGVMEGAAFHAQVRSEARRGKLARISVTRDPPRRRPALEAWTSRLPGAARLEFEESDEADEAIETAFDEALSPSLTLPTGGRLHIARTPALTAIDVDTAGRPASGKPAERGRALNVCAARETARQLALRRLGGLAVMDCVGPVRKSDGAQVKAAFLATFRGISSRKAEALAPSPFGLMEISTAWRETPVEDLYRTEDGAPTPLAELLAGLRALEREARARPAATLTLLLPPAALDAFGANHDLYRQAMEARFGPRLNVRGHDKPETEVRYE